MTRSGFLRAIEEILGVPRHALKESDSRETIEGWTSLADVQLFGLIENELGIEADGELIEAETVGELVRILAGRGAFRG
jgi:acyl carrier protein